ncbi:GCN5-related N-acetyltransferase [Kribbella flavida DSM 17836]|uniref:GCN5-related N-acetyltransferase n=1 Tax=Kribbella flavida (strain DSM 17836 / JCM 10339 / NBRC 14399) TaxID=479435 RepID=D2PNU2_KRIFD|nr:GNAT family N-acetyltransferase [Kribbella flavida]ADB32760.1 GCN5-related N-acetyltransferase [Kribbella flavida DSM 17836]
MAPHLVLPEPFTARPATTADVPAVHALVGAVERELLGRTETGADGIEASLTRPGLDAAVDSLVVHAPDGQLTAWAWINRGRRAQIDVAPAFRGHGIGSALLDWTEARAAEVGTDWLAQNVDDKDRAGTELLRSRGYEVLAKNWQLEMPVAEVSVELPEGFTVRPFQPDEARAAYQLIEDAFDEWQPRRKSYEEWARLSIERASFAPALSPVAFAGGELVGAALCLDLPDPDDGYVEQVAVRKDQRGRGLARALLAIAARGFRAQGKHNLTLWTHSDTGALAMYERLGMSVRRSTTVYRGRVRAAG